MLAGQLAALAGALGWAAGGVVIKTVSGSVRAIQISAVYSWVAVIMVLPVVALAGRIDDVTSMSASSMGWLVAAGALYTVSDLAFIRLLALGAVGWTFVTTTSLFILFSLLAGVLLLGDQTTWTAYVGATAIVAGIYLVNRRETPTSEEPADRDSGRKLRARVATSAGIAVFWTAGLLATDLGVDEADPFASALVLSLVPAVFYVLLAAAGRVARLASTTAKERRRVLLSALFFGSSVMAWTYALKFESAGIIAVLSSSAPLFAVLLAFVFLKERLTVGSLVGIGLCSAGVATVLVG